MPSNDACVCFLNMRERPRPRLIFNSLRPSDAPVGATPSPEATLVYCELDP